MRVAFDRFAFDSDRRELRDGARSVHLGPKAFRLLEILLEQRPRPVSKQQLYEAIWGETFVDESNLAGLISELRAALGDRARQPTYIRTVHGFGYAFRDESASDTPAKAWVVFHRRKLPLREGMNVLGRDPTADVQIDHVTVSRRHAAITIGTDGSAIEDLSSKNGTFIDGVPVQAPMPLREGQTIVLGDAAIVFRSTPGGSTVSVSRLRRKG